MNAAEMRPGGARLRRYVLVVSGASHTTAYSDAASQANRRLATPKEASDRRRLGSWRQVVGSGLVAG